VQGKDSQDESGLGWRYSIHNPAPLKTVVNQDTSKLFQFNLSGLTRWLVVLTTVLLLGSVGLGWLVNGFLILLGFLLISPVIAWVGLRWWLRRNLVEDKCPVCAYEFTGFNRTECQCPSCGESLKVEQGHFYRFTPPGTIDVEAVEVSARQLED
jgi:hypothetical protein